MVKKLSEDLLETPTLIQIITLPNSTEIDLTAQYLGGNSILHLAVLSESLMNTRFLVEKGASTTIKNKEGETALHIAAYTNQLPITSYLAMLPKTTNRLHAACFQDNLGFTALHYAVLHKNVEIVRLLIQYHPEIIPIKTISNFTSLDFAAVKQNLIIFEMLSDTHFKQLNLQQRVCILSRHQFKAIRRLIDHFPDIITNNVPFSPIGLLKLLLENHYPSPKLIKYLEDEYNLHSIFSEKTNRLANVPKKSFIAYLKKITHITAAGHFVWTNQAVEREIIQILFYFIERNLLTKLRKHPNLSILSNNLMRIDTQLKKAAIQNAAIVVIALSRYLEEDYDAMRCYLEDVMVAQLPCEKRSTFLNRDKNGFYSPAAGILMLYARDSLHNSLNFFCKNIETSEKPACSLSTKTARSKDGQETEPCHSLSAQSS